MKNKITFAEMNAFINYVVENTVKYGVAYRKVLTDYCVCLYYGEKEFSSDDIAVLYDNGELNTSGIDVNPEQFGIILNAIYDGIETETRYKAAKMVASEANEAISTLVNTINIVLSNTSKFDLDEANKAIQTLNSIKGEMTTDKFVSALVDTGVIKGSDSRESDIKVGE